MSKRAIIYARVSSLDQRSNFSIPTQIEECQKYLQEKGYLLVGDHFVDADTGLDSVGGNGAIPAYVDNFSSRELNRPGLDLALTYLEEQGYDVMVVHALDRLARDPYIRQTLEIEFGVGGANVEYALGGYEDTPDGEVRKDIDATFAKWENAKRVERSLRGKRKKAEKGLFVGGRTPYGYTLDPDVPGGLAVDQDQAAVVQWIFEQYAAGSLSIGGIAADLSEKQVLTKSGKTKWCKSSVKAILENTAYVGYVFYNKFKCHNNSTRVERPREEWIRIEIEALVDQATFKAVQRMRRDHREAWRRKPKHFYLLSRMLRCEDCQRPFRANYRKARPKSGRKAYRSYRHMRREEGCINREISAHLLEPVVWEKIMGMLVDPQTLRAGYEQAIDLEAANQSKNNHILGELYQEIDNLDMRHHNLVTAYTDPDIGMKRSEFLAHREQIQDAIAAVHQRIQEVERELSTLPTRIEFESLERFSKAVSQSMGSDDWEFSDQEKRQFLEALNVKVYIAENGDGRITGWFGEIDGFSFKSR